jgi:hypothetical protein
MTPRQRTSKKKKDRANKKFSACSLQVLSNTNDDCASEGAEKLLVKAIHAPHRTLRAIAVS